MPTLKQLTFILLGAVLAAIVSGCGSPSEPAGEQSSSNKTLTIGLGTEPANLDPRNYNYTAGTFAVAWQIFEPLVYHDTGFWPCWGQGCRGWCWQLP